MAHRRTCVRVSAGLALALAAGSASAQINSNWLSAASDNWSNPVRWSTNPDIPNNGANTYHATISATGAAYSVTLDLPITVTDLTVNSADATLLWGGSHTLNVLNNATLGGGSTINGAGLGGLLQVAGTLTIGNSTVVGLGILRANGPIIYSHTVDVSFDDTDIDHGDGSALWMGPGDIVLGQGATMTNGASCTFTIQSDQQLRFSGSGAATSFTNLGTIIRNTGTGTADVQGVAFDNQGILDVQTGTFRADTVSNISSNQLTGGTYRVGGGSIDFTGTTILTNAATVEYLAGPGSFTAFDSLTTNAATGTLNVGAGRLLTKPGSLTNQGTIGLANTAGLDVSGSFVNDSTFTAGDSATLSAAGLTNSAAASLTLGTGGTVSLTGNLLNDGTLTTGAGTDVALAAGFALQNVSAGTLTGGTFHLGGDLKADNLAGLTTLAGRVMLDGPAATLRDGANLDVAPGITTVASGGELGVLGGRTLTTSSNLTLGATGQLTVGVGSDLTVNGTITNFSSGTFTGGQLDIEGTLRFNGAAIDTIDADIALTNATADIVDENGNSAFAALNTITPSGSFEISGGRSLTLSGALGSAGALTVGSGSTLSSPGFVTQFNGSTNLNGTLSTPTLFVADGLLSGAGTLAGNLDCDGDFNPGNSPGLFTVDGDANFRPSSLVIAEIGGLVRGIDHDAIDILGGLSFEFGASGTFQVELLPGYVASVGDEFFVIRYSERQGHFQNVILPGLPGGLSFQFFYDVPSPTPGDTSRFIQLVVVPAPAGGLALAAGLFALGRRRRTH
ncbi:MAG: hypothetical protein IT433_01270 [Phycisphaerales bacterium]|nr:hypothetical protein [Phycisphaerales bacterium]